MKISERLLLEFDHEMGTTRKCLERIPENKFTFKPHAKSFDMIGLATHIATMTGWATSTLASDSFDVAPAGGEPYKPPVMKSTAELLAAFDKGVTEFRTALGKADDEAMVKPWSLLAGGKVMFTMPRAGVLRSMILNHLIHHRGQLTVYLRMCDIPVPSIYGPSADEQS
jgi:uncharacterized damage-inducible protein DinB